MQKYSKVMYIGRNSLEFIGKVAEALTEDDLEFYNKRIDIASMNTWNKRAEIALKGMISVED